jgi:16S rRNA (cytidine1402-2'-O)-methyltransferase
MKKSKLSIVATPIGNLEDITLRAIRTLKESDLIACENTSDAQRLLKHYDIETPTTVYFANSRLSHADKIMSVLDGGGHVSLISDAGTPAISDPGVLLIQKVRDTMPDCIIETIPGASALVAALSVSGFVGNQFTFFGFVPHKKGRETLVKDIVQHEYISIVYESVHRVEKFLESLQHEMETSGVQKQVLVARELTKLHEQLVRGTAVEVCEYFKLNTDKIRGEFVILIDASH